MYERGSTDPSLLMSDPQNVLAHVADERICSTSDAEPVMLQFSQLQLCLTTAAMATS